MSKTHCSRPGCKDVFRAFLIKNAHFEGNLEMPGIMPQDELPNKLILFSKILDCKDYDQWVCFYEDDAAFERIWNNPKRYLPLLSKFRGVISPDFSLYRDMPLVMQYWNIYRNRAIGHWLQENGIHVITNIRWGDERTYRTCCIGAPKHSIIAIGSHGCIKLLNNREHFKNGLAVVVNELKPKAIVVYGSAPDALFEEYENSGIIIKRFQTDIELSRKGVDV